MSRDISLFAMYLKEDQHYTGWADKSRKLMQKPSHADTTHTIHHIRSEIDSKSWTPNTSLHISYVKCIANNGYMVEAKKYDELDDVELNVATFMDMLNYSVASLEVIEIYIFNNNHKRVSEFFYSIIFDKFRYKLKGPIDINHILKILVEKSKQVKELTIDFVDEYSATMESLVQSSKQLESITLLDPIISDTFTFDHMPSTLKHLSLVHGELKVKNFNTSFSELRNFNLFLPKFQDLSFLRSAKNLENVKITGRDMNGFNLSELTCFETLQRLSLECCSLSDASFQFLDKCSQLKSVSLDAIDGTRIVRDVLDLPAIQKLVLSRHYDLALSPCNTLKILHLEPIEWNIDEEVLIHIFEQMPNLRYLKVSQDTEETKYFTAQTYKLMKSVLSNSDLTFIMYRRTLNNYGAGDVIVVQRGPSKLHSVNFEFESTFFLDFFPNFDVYEPFKTALGTDGLNYHIKCLARDEYNYIQMDI